MLKSKKRLLLFSGILILGIGFGLFASNEDFPSSNRTESQMVALIVFSGSLGFMLLAFVIERIAICIGRFLRRMIGGQQTFRSIFSEWGDPIIPYMGWFLISLGIGLGTSGLWLESNRFWTGLIYFSGGVGLMIGWMISKRLFNKLYV